jgi:hypothetical protein
MQLPTIPFPHLMHAPINNQRFFRNMQNVSSKVFQCAEKNTSAKEIPAKI